MYENLRSVTWAGDRFVAVGNEGFVISSSDGIDWTVNRCFASMNLRDVIATPAGLLVVGSNGAILQSDAPLPTIRVRFVPGGLELTVTGDQC